ncbi:MAG TPA: hypothetical protein VFZ66_24655 [Herpetosiphonaceae bacterium]
MLSGPSANSNTSLPLAIGAALLGVGMALVVSRALAVSSPGGSDA